MKTTRKVLALILAMVMVMGLATVAMAEDIETKSCKITMGDEKSSYGAYQLMTATVSGTNYSYTVVDKYASAMATALNLQVGWKNEDIIDALSKMSSNATAIRNFADAVFTALQNASAEFDYTATNGVFNVPYGYYLIAETAAGTSNTYSLTMIDTADKAEMTVDLKEDTVTSDKKVQDKNDSTGETSEWQDSADYDIGDNVPFRLSGTVAKDFESYDNAYKYVFHDKMSAGLTFQNDVVVKYQNPNSQTEVVIDSSKYNVVTSGIDCTFEVQFADLKTIEGLVGGATIYVYFTAELNENADIGNPGNPNTSNVEFSNNPYDKGTGTTPDDTVVVFTYKVVINKVDGTTNEPLPGAKFTLSKYDEATETWIEKEVVVTEEGTTFTFTGLDDGYYKLEETKVPDGYNKIDPIYFTVKATHAGTVITWDDNSKYLEDLTATETTEEHVNVDAGSIRFEATPSVDDGSLTSTVKNNSGTELPETGGIGTTIFYVVGTILLFGAAVLLVTKRRMAA